MEITAIDARVGPGPVWTPGKFAGPITRATTRNPVYMRDVKSMVHGVIVRLGRSKLRRLNIVDHGNEHGFEVGDDVITEQSIGGFAPQLALLKGRFAAQGFVHLQHCKVGDATDLLLALAAIVGARVYAGTGIDYPGFNTGDYWGCDAPGTCTLRRSRP